MWRENIPDTINFKFRESENFLGMCKEAGEKGAK